MSVANPAIIMINLGMLNIPGSSTTAPTPVNSYVPGAEPVAGKARPSIQDIHEDADEQVEGGNPASMLARNLSLFDAVDASMVTDYLNTLSPAVRNRVTGLKGVQQSHSKVESEFQAEVLALEKKFALKYAPIYERKAAIISGVSEPTEEELAAGLAALEEEGEEVSKETVNGASDVKGIPEFWLMTLKNHPGIGELITERDEEALKYLTDLKITYLDTETSGFKFTFTFAPNAFFTDSELTKEYHYQKEIGSGGDFVYEKAVGCEIAWNEDQDLTKKIEVKKQRNKNTNRTRTVKRVVPSESFFNFFKPPMQPTTEAIESGEVEESDLAELEERLELDYQIGEDLKERVIPRAIDYFTGKALSYEFDDDEDDEFDDDEYENEYGNGEDYEDVEEPQKTHPVPGSSAEPQEFSLTMAQEPLVGRKFGGKERRPLGNCPICRFTAVEVLEAGKEAPVDDASINIHHLACVADLVSPYYGPHANPNPNKSASNTSLVVYASADPEAPVVGKAPPAEDEDETESLPSIEANHQIEKKTGKVSRNSFGNLCASAVRLTDLPPPEGTGDQHAIFFFFHDISVRAEGSYSLRLRVFDLQSKSTSCPEHHPVLAQTFTRVFKIYAPRNYPGVPPTTALAKHFNLQRMRVNVRKPNGRPTPTTSSSTTSSLKTRREASPASSGSSDFIETITPESESDNA